MITNRKITGRAASMPIGLLEGTLVSIMLTIMASAMIAKMVDKEVLLWEHMGYGIMIALLTASMAGSIVSIHRIKHRVLLVATLSGLLYALGLLVITALMFGGQYEAVGVTLSLILGGSLATGLICVRRGERKNSQKNRLRHR